MKEKRTCDNGSLSRKARRKLLPVLLLILTALFGGVCHAAKATVDDQAGLLNAQEASQLLSQAQETADTTGFDIAIVSTDDARGKSAQVVAEDYYAADPRSEDEVVCLIDMDNREIHLRTFGQAIWYLTDARIDDILDDAYSHISEGDYAGTFSSMVGGVRYYFDQGIPEGTYQHHTDTGVTEYYEAPKTVSALEGIISGILGLLTGAGIFSGVSGRYNMKVKKPTYDLSANSDMKLNVQTDQVVNRYVTHRRIPRQTSSSDGGHRSGGGGSSVHTGSGGHVSGGGGRKF